MLDRYRIARTCFRPVDPERATHQQHVLTACVRSSRAVSLPVERRDSGAQRLNGAADVKHRLIREPTLSEVLPQVLNVLRRTGASVSALNARHDVHPGTLCRHWNPPSDRSAWPEVDRFEQLGDGDGVASSLRRAKSHRPGPTCVRAPPRTSRPANAIAGMSEHSFTERQERCHGQVILGVVSAPPTYAKACLCGFGSNVIHGG